MKLMYGIYLIIGGVALMFMLNKQEDLYDCAGQMSQYEIVEQTTDASAHNNAHFIAVEYAAALEACKANPQLVSKPAQNIVADAARQETKDEALKLLKERAAKSKKAVIT